MHGEELGSWWGRVQQVMQRSKPHWERALETFLERVDVPNGVDSLEPRISARDPDVARAPARYYSSEVVHLRSLLRRAAAMMAAIFASYGESAFWTFVFPVMAA